MYRFYLAAALALACLVLGTAQARAEYRERMFELAEEIGLVAEQETVCAKTEEARLRAKHVLDEFMLLVPMTIIEQSVKSATDEFEYGRQLSKSKPSPEDCRITAEATRRYESYLVMVRAEVEAETDAVAQEAAKTAATLSHSGGRLIGWADACGVETNGAEAKVLTLIGLSTPESARVAKGVFERVRTRSYQDIINGFAPGCADVDPAVRIMNIGLDLQLDALAR